MNYQELVEKIHQIGLNEVGHENFDRRELDLDLVVRKGGNESGGDYAERIFVHNSENEQIYVRITGYYSSYEGADYDTIKQVYPKEVMQTVYTTDQN